MTYEPREQKDHEEKEYADLLLDFIDWPKRAGGENGFFAKILREHGCRTVFDSCLGDGYDAFSLIRQGLEVTGNEYDPLFREKAITNAKELGIRLDLTPGYDWRDIPDHLDEKFDAVICLGNALTYMMTRSEQELATHNFHKILRPGGIAIIDHRNYDYMLDEREHILADPRKNFRYSGNYYYCGDKVGGYPVSITDEAVVMEYDNTARHQRAHLTLYPFRRNEVIGLMEGQGLHVVGTYGDFQLDRIDGVDFFQHVGRKEC